MLSTLGNGEQNQLGLGANRKSVKLPFLITSLTRIATIKSISCGGNHSMALSETGLIYTWGDNTYGQLGEIIHISLIC